MVEETSITRVANDILLAESGHDLNNFWIKVKKEVLKQDCI